MLNETRLVITRDITVAECPWIGAHTSGLGLEEGVRVWAYDGPMYGCVSSTGYAVTFDPIEGPFFEVPQNAVRPLLPVVRPDMSKWYA
jgi:hypothetical protein